MVAIGWFLLKWVGGGWLVYSYFAGLNQHCREKYMNWPY